MRRLLLVLGNDVRRHLKSPLAILIYIAIPMVMTGAHRHHLRPPDRGEHAAAHRGPPRRPGQGLRFEAPAGGLRRRRDEEDVRGDRDRRGRGPQAHGEGQGLGHDRHPGGLHPRPARQQDDDSDRGQEPGRAVPARRRRGVREHAGRHALGSRPGLRRGGQGHPGHARRTRSTASPGRRSGRSWARPRRRWSPPKNTSTPCSSA